MKPTFTSKRSWLLGTAALALAVSGTAYAQDASADDEEEAVQDVVIVTGIRGSIANSIAAKRNSDLIVEAISAEDIGKLPDTSIAESLARLPGLTAQRLRGRAQVISIRGLGPDFTTALLNGREQVTAGDNRGVEFDQYPSELLSSVLVYKTPDAALIGQGLAGTADLRTARPLDYDGRVMSVSARYEWNDIGALNAGSDDDGYRFSGAYIDQFANDTIGIAVGFATQSSPTQAERWDSWGYPTTGPNNAFVLGGAKPYVESRELERTAVMGTFEYEPVGAFSTSADIFISHFEDSGILRGIELPLFWSGAQLQPGFTEDNGFVNSGIFNGVQGVVRNDFRGREADIFSAGWNMQYDLNDVWSLEGDLSISKVERDDVDLETYSGTAAGFGNGASDNLAFLQTGDGTFVFGPSLDYTDTSLFGLTDPQGWGQAGFIKRPSTDDELTAIRGSATRDFDNDYLSSVEMGVNYTQREKSKRSEEAFLDLANPDANGVTPIPTNLLLSPTSLEFIGIPGTISYDPMALLNSGVYTIRPNTNPDVVTKAWDVQEDVLTLYVKANVDAELGGIPVRGNFGFQYVDTDQASQGARIGNGFIETVDEGDSYGEFLPSANFSFEFPNDQYVRIGAARTLARARLDQIRASQSFGINTSLLLFPGELAADPTAVTGIDIANNRAVFNPGGGNPALRPYVADGFDLSYEKYFGSSGYVSAAVFYKDLKDFVFDNSTSLVDFSGIVDLAAAGGAFIDPITGLTVDAATIRSLNPGIDTGILSLPSNGNGGHIQGVEFAASIPGDLFFDGPLGGLGVLASVSFTDSEVTPEGFTSAIQIPGLSETVGNITVYYEWDGFEARISNRYRSEFLGEVTGFGANRDFRSIKSESVVDAQIGYEFGSGIFDGLTVQLQANNLTEEEFVSFLNGDERLVKDFQQYGTTYLLGLSYRFK